MSEATNAPHSPSSQSSTSGRSPVQGGSLMPDTARDSRKQSTSGVDGVEVERGTAEGEAEEPMATNPHDLAGMSLTDGCSPGRTSSSIGGANAGLSPPDPAGMTLTDGCSRGRTSSSIVGANADQQLEAEDWGAAGGREQQHRRSTMRSDGSSGGVEHAVLTGGTAVPGHHSPCLTGALTGFRVTSHVRIGNGSGSPLPLPTRRVRQCKL